jgi:hypothetical protein
VAFDAIVYQETTKQQWEEAAEACHAEDRRWRSVPARRRKPCSTWPGWVRGRVSSAAECVRFERESFGELLQMLSDVPEQEQEQVWAEIEVARGEYATDAVVVGPCELHVLSGTR